MYEFLHAQLNYAIMHVETYQKGELKREFLKKGIPFLRGIQKEEGGEIFRRNSCRNSLFGGSGKKGTEKGNAQPRVVSSPPHVVAVSHVVVPSGQDSS